MLKSLSWSFVEIFKLHEFTFNFYNFNVKTTFKKLFVGIFKLHELTFYFSDFCLITLKYKILDNKPDTDNQVLPNVNIKRPLFIDLAYNKLAVTFVHTQLIFTNEISSTLRLLCILKI